MMCLIKIFSYEGDWIFVFWHKYIVRLCFTKVYTYWLSSSAHLIMFVIGTTYAYALKLIRNTIALEKDEE